jgi:PmbA protein
LPEQPELFNSELETVSVEDKVAAAAVLEAGALDYDPAITAVAYTRYADYSGQTWIANTNGLWGTYCGNGCVAYAACLAKDGDGAVSSGQVESTRVFSELHPEIIAQKAAQKTLERRGAQRPKTGKYAVVFENRVAEELLGLMAPYFSAKAVDEGVSPLKGQLGKPRFSNSISIVDDPFYFTAGGSRPFDAEGYASHKTELVKNGVVNAFLTNSVYAKKMNLPHTASAARTPTTDLDVGTTNLILQAGSASFEDLVGAEKTVILVKDVLGFAGFRSTSGDFSIPMEGDIYENGKRSGALKDFAISGNILDLFSEIEGLANDVLHPVGRTISPSFLVRNLNVVGQS